MSTKTVLENGDVRVDFDTGDPEGHRSYLLRAYRNFLREVRKVASAEVLAVFDQWKIKEVPRLSGEIGFQIEYPEGFPEEDKQK